MSSQGDHIILITQDATSVDGTQSNLQLPKKVCNYFRDRLRRAGVEVFLVAVSFMLMVIYLTVVGVVYHHNATSFSGNNHTSFDGVYFTVVTLTTVGYGDLVPTTTGTKLFAIVLSVVGTTLSAILFLWVESLLEKIVKALLEKIVKAKRSWKLVLSSIIVLAGFICIHPFEGNGYFESFYLTVMSVTSVGYGDASFKTLAGRIFASIWLVMGTRAVIIVSMDLHKIILPKMKRLFSWLTGDPYDDREEKMAQIFKTFALLDQGKKSLALKGINDLLLELASETNELQLVELSVGQQGGMQDAPRVEPRVGERDGMQDAPRVEPRVEPRVGERGEPRVGERGGMQDAPRVEPRVEPRVGERGGMQDAPRVEPPVEERGEIQDASPVGQQTELPVGPPGEAQDAPPVGQQDEIQTDPPIGQQGDIQAEPLVGQQGEKQVVPIVGQPGEIQDEPPTEQPGEIQDEPPTEQPGEIQDEPPAEPQDKTQVVTDPQHTNYP